jgi:uncharacterized peroxidase-related enzyme
MYAHLEDLRAEVRGLPEPQRSAWSNLVADWRNAPLDEREHALCVYAEKLTRAPASMNAEDLAPLRMAGLSDAAIHEAIQVVAYFNYINRVADAVHVDLEPGMPAYPRGAGPASTSPE